MTRSHQVAAPIATRNGMARGAVIGNHDTSRAQVVSMLPKVAKETMKPSTRTMVTGPAMADASSVRVARAPRVPYTVAYSA